MAKKKKSSAKKAAAAAAASSRGVVGPDYVQVLSGTLGSKSVALVLCGESHHDAIDVTRAGGGKIKEGWVDTDLVELTGEMVGKLFGGEIDDGNDDGEDGGIAASNVRVRCGICKRNNKYLPLGKAREWGRDVGHEEIDYIDPGREMALLWVQSNDGNGGTNKGRSYLVELFLEESEEEEEEQREDNKSRRSHLPSDVMELLDGMSNAAKIMRGIKRDGDSGAVGVHTLSKVVQDMKNGTIPGLPSENNSHHTTLLSWADLDTEARLINHRRILGEEVLNVEYDQLICERKKKIRKNENSWTWDDWLVEVKSKLLSSANSGNSADTISAPGLHVVLESSIPPWEVELSRGDAMPAGFEYAQAADCIRCLSEDSDASEMDAYDPSSDGAGSYIDYAYRRLLGMERSLLRSDIDGAADDPIPGNNGFLHCVDCRDLGCEHSCVEDSLRKDWMELLHPDDKEKLLGSGPDAAHAHRRDGRCLPDWCCSPEESEMDRLRSAGVLRNDDDADDDRVSGGDPDGGNIDDKADLITFPSMELFLGQCTDILYYTPNCKVAYGPFLGKCVRSYDVWGDFFAELFFGGTVDRALAMLDLSNESSPYLHIRSPIMKYWNPGTGEYEWHRRDDEEHDLTLPMLPVKSFLKARGSEPARTWSSNIFASLLEGDYCQEFKDLATDARRWVLDDIAKHCCDPKLSDDDIGGGEWFLAYLRQCHREIYDDIDRSDATILLRKQKAVGDTKTHKIGAISIPNCRDGFHFISEELSRKGAKLEKPTLSAKAEVMAKILIDIYMSKLIDASTVVKIAQIIAQEVKKNVVVVCYMGSVHTRAVCDFFTQPKYGFRRKVFCGKQDWDVDEARILHLPVELWDLNALFK